METIINEIDIVTEHLSDLIFFVKKGLDESYRITYANEVFKNTIQLSNDNYAHAKLDEAFSNENYSDLTATINSVLQSGEKDMTEVVIESFGRKNAYEVTIIPIKKGRTDNYCLVVCHDITSRKNYEEQLRRLKQEAEESSRLKDSLLLNINHEFRTPLHGILGITEMLSEDATDPNHQAMLKSIMNSGRRLLNTLVSIIELSRLEALEEKVYTTKVILAEVIISVLEKYKYEAEHKGLLLEFEFSDNELKAHVDESFLRQVITNLIDNALKFTKKGKVKVSLEKFVNNGNNYALIKIIDTGIGISKKSLEKIFNAFIQESEGVGRSHEGIGLGLTLVKQMTKMMGGEVTAESEKNVGSTFTLKFPALNDENISQKTERDRPPVTTLNNLENITSYILIVEDNEMNSTLTKTFLKNNYQVDIASNAVEAMKLASLKSYNAILMDINLGSGMNGVELLHEIKKNMDYTDIPVIAMTGYAFNSDKINFLNCGFTNYIAKPFSKQQILKILEETLVIASPKEWFGY